LEITRTNGDKLNNGFGEATNLLRSLINNRQSGITDSDKIASQTRLFRDTQGTTERMLVDFPVLGNRTNIGNLENKVSKNQPQS